MLRQQNAKTFSMEKLQKQQDDIMPIKVMQVLIMLKLSILTLNYSLKMLNLQLEIN